MPSQLVDSKTQVVYNSVVKMEGKSGLLQKKMAEIPEYKADESA